MGVPEHGGRQAEDGGLYPEAPDHPAPPLQLLVEALNAKELLPETYTATTTEEARAHLADFYELADGCVVPEVERLSRTVRRWEEEILSLFTTGHSNAKFQAMNLITENLRTVAHGMRNFENYRLRLLLHSGFEWKTAPTARIRGRHLRLVA